MVEKRTYDFYCQQGSIKDLDVTEKNVYLKYLETAYVEDLNHARHSLLVSPKWSIIAGYYAMHNISKYYLGLKFGKKISLPEIHNATIVSIKELVDNLEVKELIKGMEEVYEIDPLHLGLRKGKEERSKTQYYMNDTKSSKAVTLEKSSFFLEYVVEKYVVLLEKLCEK